ncbi:aldehyde dehydrogenase (NAD+) [Anaerosolibacter carboniphilus]|uniref:Aldehyde dehydrogenase n=1 Tax=Anaerosolibacter carboniphilus TaxID=1417629 RepID=A0A841KV40_9FIRM|nr:aldehyde dehydrogenase (NAD+) [Anaerosolibacter carboniphilus]
MGTDYSNEIKGFLKIHRDYFETGRTKDVDFRIEQLKRLKDAIQSYEGEIMEALHKDLRKPPFESFATEIGYVKDSIGYTLKHIRGWAKGQKVKTPMVHFGARSAIHPEPYGTVLIIAPWNYPFQLMIEPMIGAMAAGNCIVLKPSEYAPHVGKVMEKMIGECFDERYVRMIIGDRELATALVNSDFDYIFFTGSVLVGKIVMEAAAKHLIPVTLELGGKSPCIVDKHGNLAVAAERIIWGKFVNAGQTCVAPDYLLVHREVKEELMQRLIMTIRKFYGDNPASSPDYCRIINKKHLKRLVNLLEQEKIITGGNYDLDDLYMAPTLMDQVSWEDPVMADEIFGPILPIIPYDDLDDVIHRINQRPKPLALYLFTENREIQDLVMQRISFGGGCINDTLSHVASPYIPFGGVGASGIGAYHGKNSFDLFSHHKSIMRKTTKFSIPLAFPPYGERIHWLKKLMK